MGSLESAATAAATTTSTTTTAASAAAALLLLLICEDSCCLLLIQLCAVDLESPLDVTLLSAGSYCTHISASPAPTFLLYYQTFIPVTYQLRYWWDWFCG